MSNSKRVLWVVLITLLFTSFSGLFFYAVPAVASPDGDTPTHDKREADSLDTCSLLSLENRIDTAHFILRWTNKSSHPQDNISDPSIVRDTGSYLETAWNKYVNTFGRNPYVAPGKKKIEVVFRDLECFGEAGPPDGPIRLSADNWVKRPGIRKPTSAHELFHKLQYAFGYRTKWNPKSSYKWFTEGSAAWSEVFVWNRVSGSYKINQLFNKPDLDLYDSEDCALPFWIFFQNQYEKKFGENPMVEFLKEYEATGNERGVLARMINKMSTTVDNFFALFSIERQLGSWIKPQGSSDYAAIVGPDGKDIVPVLNVNEIPVKEGKPISKSGSVAQLGSGYYRFKFAPNVEGRTLNVAVKGTPNRYLCSLGWEKGGKWCQRAAPPSATGNYGLSEKIDLKNADSLLLVISGNEKGGKYSIDVTVN